MKQTTQKLHWNLHELQTEEPDSLTELYVYLYFFQIKTYYFNLNIG